MGFHELVQALEKEGDLRCEAILAQADATAAQVLDTARAAARTRLEQQQRLAKADTERQAHALLSLARRERHRLVLEAQHAELSALQQAILEAPPPSLVSLAEEAMVGLEPPLSGVVFGDVQTLKAAFPHIAWEAADGSPGVEIRVLDGRIVHRNTTADRLQKIWPEVLPEVAHLLFGS